MQDYNTEYENPLQFRRPLSESAWSDGVVVVHQTRISAVVFADNKVNRTAPFCAVVFLLAKEGRRFHVVDFIRRATGYESYSALAKPKVLNLHSGGFLHFYFTEFLGGRKWDFDTDEFYIVRHNKLRRTLLLKNVSAFLSPADPYREFTQDADVQCEPRATPAHRETLVDDGRETGGHADFGGRLPLEFATVAVHQSASGWADFERTQFLVRGWAPKPSVGRPLSGSFVLGVPTLGGDLKNTARSAA